MHAAHIRNQLFILFAADFSKRKLKLNADRLHIFNF